MEHNLSSLLSWIWAKEGDEMHAWRQLATTTTTTTTTSTNTTLSIAPPPQRQLNDYLVIFLPILPALASLCSSLYLISRLVPTILRSPRQRAKPRDHFVLGLSLMDCCSSLGFSFSTFPAPRGAVENGRYMASGNVQTCTAQAFLVQVGAFGGPFYNTALCLYYVAFVRYHIRNEFILKWIVPVVHVIIPFVVSTEALYALFNDLYNQDNRLGCWVANTVDTGDCPDPADPSSALVPEACGRGSGAQDFKLVVFALGGTCFVIIFLSMLVLYCTVRKTEANARRWDPTLRYQADGSGGHSMGDNNNKKSKKKQKSVGPTSSYSMSQQTMEKGLWYSFNYLLVYSPAVLASFVDPDKAEVLRLLNCILLPSQGFFNMLTYTAPEWRPWLDRKQKALCRHFHNDGGRRTGTDDPTNESHPSKLAVWRHRHGGGSSASTATLCDSKEDNNKDRSCRQQELTMTSPDVVGILPRQDDTTCNDSTTQDCDDENAIVVEVVGSGDIPPSSSTADWNKRGWTRTQALLQSVRDSLRGSGFLVSLDNNFVSTRNISRQVDDEQMQVHHPDRVLEERSSDMEEGEMHHPSRNVQALSEMFPRKTKREKEAGHDRVIVALEVTTTTATATYADDLYFL